MKQEEGTMQIGLLTLLKALWKRMWLVILAVLL